MKLSNHISIYIFIYPIVPQSSYHIFYPLLLSYRSLPKLSSQDEEGGAGHGFGGGPQHFEPIPHDHDFCERVVINVSISLSVSFSILLSIPLSLPLSAFDR